MKESCCMRFKYLIICLFCIIISKCKTPDDTNQVVDRWTSSDPLALHIKIREQKLLKGNLIQNASFEYGKIKKTDSNTYQTKINGWEIIGSDVQWITINNSLEKNRTAAHRGNHAIVITRQRTSETEEFGQGVMSDYIKVIPGNYLLSMYLKLKDIKNAKSRLGTKIYDAVDIKVLYYDKNKLQIKDSQFSAFYESDINISFKGYSFSNYSSIDSTGWLHVLGRSHLFPFQDGDLPDETRYVRIFIGLKGSGTMYIDDVSYEYNRWNFTTLERISSLFDSTFSKGNLIIPQPKKLKLLESRIYCRPFYTNCIPIILISPSADPVTKFAAKQLEKELQRYLTVNTEMDSIKIPDLIRTAVTADFESVSIIFSLGTTELFKKYSSQLPLDEIKGHPQGYIIHTLNAIPNTIFLYGNTPDANYYAVQSAKQLFDNKRLLFHNCNVVDYPDNEIRPFLLVNDELEKQPRLATEFMDNTRFNSIYISGQNSGLSTKINRISRPGLFSVYLYFEDFLPSDQTSDNPKTSDVNKIKSVIINYANQIDGVAFLIHSPFSHQISLEAIREYYHTDLFQLYNYSQLSQLISLAGNNRLNVEILPPYSDNLKLNEDHCIHAMSGFFSQHIDDISMIWSGYGLSSWRIDEADIIRFKNAYNKWPVFMDLTMYPRSRYMNYFSYDSLYPYKLKKACLFEAYSNEVVDEVHNLTPKVIVAYGASNVFDEIRIQTASDYLWNPDSYNPELSLYRALVSRFGIEISHELLKANDLYFKIKSELIFAKDQKSGQKHLRRASSMLNELKLCNQNLNIKKQDVEIEEIQDIINELIIELENTKQGLH